MLTVNKIIAAHNRGNTGLNSSFKRWIIHLKLRSFINNFIYMVSRRLLRIVYKVLSISHNLLVLDSFHSLLRKNVPKVWVFSTEVFKVTATNRYSFHVEAWS